MINENNRPIVHVGFDSPNSWGKIDFRLDPQQGYLPVQISQRLIAPDRKPYPEMQIYVLAAREFDGGRWFPTHIVGVSFPEPGQSAFLVRDIRVTELEVDQKLTAEDLAIDIPAGTVIRPADPKAHHKHYFRLRQNEQVSPDDIPGLANMLAEAKNNPLMDTAIVRPDSAVGSWLMIGGGVLLACAACFVYYRRRNHVVP